MSLIEQAAKRLEELRRAGTTLHEDPTSAVVESERDDQTPTPEAVMRALEAQTRNTSSQVQPTVLRTPRPPTHHRHIDIDLERLSARGYLTPGTTPRSLTNFESSSGH
jgi:hypothetical protein